LPEIYGDRIFIVEDRMNSRKSDYHFDVWFPDRSDALIFGAKETYIEILES
jgi:3D (Asp-Asp-Asp) domain-containing protein